MTVDSEKMPTLLSYLSPESNRFRLRILLSSGDELKNSSDGERFVDSPRCEPFARFGRGAVVTDEDKIFRYLVLLRQADHYDVETSQLFPYSNPDVDRVWQEAFLRYSVNTPHMTSSSVMIRLKEQIDKTGGVVPFQSLFYCSHLDRFFHPPCPHCGRALDLCSDDAQLNAKGLPPYSQSLRRYLWCPMCGRDTENAEFYTYKREKSDPPWVKDRHGLVSGFDMLNGQRVKSNDFPCSECKEQQVCYGRDKRLFSRIYPYAFYPFYLFIFDGNLVSAIPFLAFVSGWQADTRKDVTDLKASGLPGWAVSDLHKRYLPRSGHFFSQAKRKRFLETLYLKLNFLFQTAKQLMTAEDALFLTSNSQYLERIWVRLPETSGDLPNFWNFTVHILDLSTNPLPNEQLPGWSSNHLRQILGRLWFYVLLTNSRQSMRAVWSELQTMLIQARSDGTSLTTMYRTRSAEPVFSYQNIYWNTEGPVCRPELWKQSLILGLRLLEVDSNLGTVFTATDFFSKFHALIEKVNHSLLGIERGRDGEEVDSISQDDAIIKVLRAILMDWEREELDAKSVGPTGVQHSAFSRQATKPTPEYMVRKKFRKDGREDLPGTIIAASKKKM